MAAEEAASPTLAADSKKRKAQVDEIEVDLNLPEPPSKKAKRLLKKGKSLPVKKGSDDEAEDEGVPTGKGKDGKEKKRSDHGIWIGNLPFTMKRAELFQWFIDSSGEAIKEQNITRVNMPPSKLHKMEDNKPQNKGFAYVDFDTEAASIAAMALTETELQGRKVLIKNAKSFEGRPQKEAAPAAASDNARGASAQTAAAGPKHIPSKKIYVGNLSFQTSEDDVRAQFDKCGEIEWLKVATFEDSGKCKGYGWVKFKEAEAAEWAVKGFVKIKEDIETEDDFRDPKDDEEEDEDAKAAAPAKKFKLRKWWVNRLHGRELKIDYAEDDQLRYKKRFGKDRPDKKQQQPRGGRPAPSGGGGEAASETAPREQKKKKTYGDTEVASYLTGAVVKPQGKKTTFD